MVKKLENTNVVMGRMIKVENTDKKFNENEKYVSLQVENENGSNERCLLFTEIELSDVEKVKIPFAEKYMVQGRIYRATIGNIETNLILVKNSSDYKMVIRVSDTQLKLAEDRAKRNPEDNTKKGIVTDLLD